MRSKSGTKQRKVSHRDACTASCSRGNTTVLKIYREQNSWCDKEHESELKEEKCVINRRLSIGDKVTLPVVPFNDHLTGIVIYIHPKRRFFRAEFTNDLGDKIREGYIFADEKIRKMGIR